MTDPTPAANPSPAEPPPPDLSALAEKLAALERVVRGMARDSLETNHAQREALELIQKLQTQMDEMRLESKGILQTVWRTGQESQASMAKAEDHFGAAIRELEARLKDEMKWQLQRGLMQSIFPALDDLDLIILNQRELNRQSGQPDHLLSAIMLVRSKFQANLRMMGLEEIKIEEGVALFDPSQHELTPSDLAVPPRQDGSQPKGTILCVRRAGYRYLDKIFRYPQVIVKE